MFDLMVIASIAAIDLNAFLIPSFIIPLTIICVLGAVGSYIYLRVICRRVFPMYEDAAFHSLYGMLTGTASTGIVLLREMDRELKGPAAENLVYQNLPAMVFGFPMMIVATLAPQIPYWTLLIIIVYFLVLNVIMFRNKIFRKRK